MYVRLATVAAVLVCSLPASAHMTEECATALSILVSEKIEYEIRTLLPDEFPPTPEMVCFDAKLEGIKRDDCPPPPGPNSTSVVLAAQSMMEEICSQGSFADLYMKRYLELKSGNARPFLLPPELRDIGP